ncbi:hypothetical protein [Ectopseudomonas oleovorans]|jgi:hypothetical protein|nr:MULTISPECIES: hypothetical protein [Pseudomonas]MDG9979098.1 hypothetical protein [Pseudomonas oleovorans]MDH0957544.1 hypothetical protein [Pseudomonas chengduensis]MDH1537924.1 hypothetical protein [Pseudomonas chengduensis]MDH2200158.1 hypothetical protein [Pseudomonas oleovorans]WKC35913.1 hypothetical protein QYM18_15705 [Pseudomonas chengduensis]
MTSDLPMDQKIPELRNIEGTKPEVFTKQRAKVRQGENSRKSAVYELYMSILRLVSTQHGREQQFVDAL